MVFQPAVVLREIADCVHGRVQEPIQYQVSSAKAHGSGTDYVDALIKTANATVRPHGMTQDDLDFASAHLDETLMSLFRYKVPARSRVSVK